MSAFFRKLAQAAARAQRHGLADATRALRRMLAAAPAADGTPPSPGRRFGAPGPGAWRIDAGTATSPTDHAEPAPAAGLDPGARFEEGRFASSAGERAFKLFEPAGFAGQRLPLVVMLHGCTQDADDFAAGTRMNRLAQEQGFFVLYPQQAPRSNAHRCWNWFVPGDQRRGFGEPALLAGMTRQIIATHPIDADRVYVAGLSAGGAMAAILAREYPDLYAAAGVHSGLPAGAAHDAGSALAAMRSGTTLPATLWPGLATAAAATARDGSPGAATGRQDSEAEAPATATHGAPLIVFHGDADATVNAVNGARVVDAALGDARWSADREVEPARPGRHASTRLVYRPPGADARTPSRAEHWLIHGAAHAWSGGDAAGSFTDERGPDASREMLRFFAEHPRVAAHAAT